jgi:hypothetical protein
MIHVTESTKFALMSTQIQYLLTTLTSLTHLIAVIE